MASLCYMLTMLQIIEKASARTNVGSERVIEVPATHWNICSINTGSRTFVQICDFLKPQWNAAKKRVTEKPEDCPYSSFAASQTWLTRSDATTGQLKEDTIARQIGSSSSEPSKSTSSPPKCFSNFVIGGKFDSSGKRTYGLSQDSGERLLKFDLTVQRRDPQLPCQMLRYERNKNFAARLDLLDELENTLVPQKDSDSDGTDDGLSSYAICGPGGMGKTQAAVEFVMSHIDSFDAIFWLRADEFAKLEGDFSRIAVELGLVLEASLEAKDLTITRELVKGWLNNPVRSYSHPDADAKDNASWLIVFDNVEDRDSLAEFWPIDGSVGSILLTSRDPLAKTQFYQVKTGCDLRPFSTADGAKLLLRLTWRDQDPEERSRVHLVADKLGGLPLALTQMASVIVRQDLSFDDFLTRYDEEEARHALFNMSFEARAKREGQNAYAHTLASTWGLELLTKSLGLIEVMSILDPDELPEFIFEKSLGQVPLEGFPDSANAYQDARSELTSSSLVTRNRQAGTLSIHRLIQDATRAIMEPDRFVLVFAFAVRLLERVWPSAGYGIRHGEYTVALRYDIPVQDETCRFELSGMMLAAEAITDHLREQELHVGHNAKYWLLTSHH